MGSELVQVDRLQAQIAEIVTLDDAVAVAGQAGALARAIRGAHLGLQAQNQAAALRLRAERRLGQILAETVSSGNRYTGSSLPDGVSKNLSSKAQKLARIPDDEFTEYLATTMAAEKEVTQSGALKLVASEPRPDSRNVADEYVVPAVDAQIAEAWDIDASDRRAQIMANAISTALRTMENPRHAYVWAKYHGIEDDGSIGPSVKYGGIAASMGTTREYVETLYYKASHFVRGHIALAFMLECGRLMDEA